MPNSPNASKTHVFWKMCMHIISRFLAKSICTSIFWGYEHTYFRVMSIFINILMVMMDLWLFELIATAVKVSRITLRWYRIHEDIVFSPQIVRVQKVNYKECTQASRQMKEDQLSATIKHSQGVAARLPAVAEGLAFWRHLEIRAELAVVIPVQKQTLNQWNVEQWVRRSVACPANWLVSGSESGI